MMHELKEWENPTCPTCAGHWLESRPHRVRWVRMHAHTWRNQSVLKHVRSNETAIVLRTCRSRPYSVMSIGYVLCEWRLCLYFAVSLGWIHFNNWRTSAVSTVDKYIQIHIKHIIQSVSIACTPTQAIIVSRRSHVSLLLLIAEACCFIRPPQVLSIQQILRRKWQLKPTYSLMQFDQFAYLFLGGCMVDYLLYSNYILYELYVIYIYMSFYPSSDVCWNRWVLVDVQLCRTVARKTRALKLHL